MSRLYFHAATATAELLGSERAHLGMLCWNVAESQLGLGWHAHPDHVSPPERVGLYGYAEETTFWG